VAFQTLNVGAFDGLLVDYAAQSGRQRDSTRHSRGVGLRIRIADGAHEIAGCGRRLKTVFPDGGEAHSFVSSRLVKEVIRLRGNISASCRLVESRLRKRLLENLGEN